MGTNALYLARLGWDARAAATPDWATAPEWLGGAAVSLATRTTRQSELETLQVDAKLVPAAVREATHSALWD